MSECDLYLCLKSGAGASAWIEFHIARSPSSSSASCVLFWFLFSFNPKCRQPSSLFAWQAWKTIVFIYLIFEQSRRLDHSKLQHNNIMCLCDSCIALDDAFGFDYIYCWFSVDYVACEKSCVFIMLKLYCSISVAFGRSRHHLRFHCQWNVQIHWLLKRRVRTPHSDEHTSIFVSFYCSIGKIGEQSTIHGGNADERSGQCSFCLRWVWLV